MDRWRAYPEDRYERALCKIIDDYADEALAKIAHSYMVEARRPEGERDEKVLRERLQLLEEQLSHLDELLEGREYVFGRYTLADITLFSPLWTLDVKGGYELIKKYENLSAWYERVKAKRG